jgi:hypothetical protein
MATPGEIPSVAFFVFGVNMSARAPELETTIKTYYRPDTGESQRDISSETLTLTDLESHTIEDEVSVAVGVTDQAYVVSANLCYLRLEETTGQNIKVRLKTGETQMDIRQLYIGNGTVLSHIALPAQSILFTNSNASICRVKITKVATVTP